jgi:L-ascorbate 6-phosphate lactonase
MTVAVTWLGQAGFLLELDGTRILVDPFVSEYEARRYPPPPLDIVADRIDWLLATHEHLDHLDTGFIPELLARCPDVKVVLPAPIARQVAGIVPAAQIVPVRPKDAVELAANTTLEVIPAYHGVEVEDGYSDGSAADGQVRFVGYVLRSTGPTIYHAGDTIVTDQLVDALAGTDIDVALLPINGRDHFREQAGLVGNMNPREAVGLAKLIGARTVVPIHWDLFEGNTERPAALLDEVIDTDTDLHVLTLRRMKPFHLA